MLTGTIRMQDELHNLGLENQNAETRMLNYNLQFLPRETMTYSLSLTNSWAYLYDRQVQENSALLAQFHGSLLPALNMSMEAGLNRNLQIPESKEFDSWNGLISLDGDMSERISTLVAYAYRQSIETSTGMLIAQSRVSGNITLRLTSTILLTGEAEMVDDAKIYTNQLYNFSWRIVPRVGLGTQASFSDQEDAQGSQRYAFYLDFEFARNGTLFCQYNNIHSGKLDQERSESAMIGIHVGF